MMSAFSHFLAVSWTRGQHAGRVEAPDGSATLEYMLLSVAGSFFQWEMYQLDLGTTVKPVKQFGRGNELTLMKPT